MGGMADDRLAMRLSYSGCALMASGLLVLLTDVSLALWSGSPRGPWPFIYSAAPFLSGVPLLAAGSWLLQRRFNKLCRDFDEIAGRLNATRKE